MTTPTTKLPITLKRSKQTFAVDLDPSLTASQWREQIQALTGVPTERQKLLCASLWKGMLKNEDSPLSQLLGDKLTKAQKNGKTNKKPIVVTLIGSAETLAQKQTSVVFVEDLTPEEQQEQVAVSWNTSMIPALQKLPDQRHDGKTEMYAYNHYVTGLPQQQIEQLLKDQQEKEQEKDATNETASQDVEMKDQTDTGAATPTPSTPNNMRLLGRVAMNLGLELRRSYINDLAVLPNGGLVSALDDGHIQLWKHGVLQDDVIHEGNKDLGNGAESVVVLQNKTSTTTTSDDKSDNNNDQSSSWPHLASAGRGSIQFWSHDAQDDTLQRMAVLPAAPVPGAQASPTSLVQIPNTTGRLMIAARFNVQEPPPQSSTGVLRLAAQTQDQRQRQEQARAQQEALRGALQRVSKSIQVWYYTNGSSNNNGTNPASNLQSKVLTPMDPSSAHALTSLVTLDRGDGTSWLISGDVIGGLRIWNVSDDASDGVAIREQAYFQLRVATEPQSALSSCCIASLHVLPDGRLAVSTDQTAATATNNPTSTTAVSVPLSRAVYILSFQQDNSNKPNFKVDAILNGHSDVVNCLLGLPNGGLLTGGGKLDATLQTWSASQLGGNEDDSDVIMEDAEDAVSPPQQTEPSVQTKSQKTISTNQGSTEKIGYVFALALLRDQHEGSGNFAVATARYNQVKILL